MSNPEIDAATENEKLLSEAQLIASQIIAAFTVQQTAELRRIPEVADRLEGNREPLTRPDLGNSVFIVHTTQGTLALHRSGEWTSAKKVLSSKNKITDEVLQQLEILEAGKTSETLTVGQRIKILSALIERMKTVLAWLKADNQTLGSQNS